jgi:hypothetical protein
LAPGEETTVCMIPTRQGRAELTFLESHR